MICHSQEFVFIHIPKTAGHTIDMQFVEAGLVDEELWHHRARDIIQMRGRTEWDRYLSFAVVRNPWDRFLSEYIWQGSAFSTQIQTHWGNKQISFYDFCRSDFAWYPDIEIANGHLSDQLSFLVDQNGELCVDEILRFETLQSDFDRVCDKIGLPKQTLPHRNKTWHKPYWEYYDDETRELVRRRFQRDIESFGYVFENPDHLSSLRHRVRARFSL